MNTVYLTDTAIERLWALWHSHAPAEAKVARDAGIERGEAWAMSPAPPFVDVLVEESGMLRYFGLRDRPYGLWTSPHIIAGTIYGERAAAEDPMPPRGYCSWRDAIEGRLMHDGRQTGYGTASNPAGTE